MANLTTIMGVEKLTQHLDRNHRVNPSPMYYADEALTRTPQRPAAALMRFVYTILEIFVS